MILSHSVNQDVSYSEDKTFKKETTQKKLEIFKDSVSVLFADVNFSLKHAIL